MTEIKAWFQSENDIVEKIKKSFPNLKALDVQEIDPKTIFFKPQSFPPVELCKNVWIIPSPELAQSPPAPLIKGGAKGGGLSDTEGKEIQITIRPGSAFGTGRHESTQLAAELISGRDAIHRVSFLDVGTGSGVLAILAKKLGAHHVDTVENDPQAVINTKENFELNNCEEIMVYSDISDVNHRTNAPSHDRTFPFYDTIIANITAPVLIELKPHFDRVLKPQGHLILSGILSHEVDNLLQKFSNYSPLKQIQKNEWVGLHLVKTH